MYSLVISVITASLKETKLKMSECKPKLKGGGGGSFFYFCFVDEITFIAFSSLNIDPTR